MQRILSYLQFYKKICVSGVCRLFYAAILDDDEKTHFLHQTGNSFGACPKEIVDLYYVHHENLFHSACARWNPEPLTRLTSRRAFALVATVYFRWYGPLPKSPKWPPPTHIAGKGARRRLKILRRRGGVVTVGKAFGQIYQVASKFEDILPLIKVYQQMHEQRDQSRVDFDWNEEPESVIDESNKHVEHEDGEEEGSDKGYHHYTMLPSAYRGDPFKFLQTSYANIYMSCWVSRAHAAFLVAIFDRNFPAWIAADAPIPYYIMNMVENLRGILSSEEDPRIEYKVC